MGSRESVMASLPNPKPVTYEEGLRMPEVQDATEEVVNGEIRIMPPAKLKHMQVIARLYDAIRSQIDQRATLAYPAGVGVVITKVPLTSRVPDLTMFAAGTMVEQDGYIHSAPQLVVEVLSPANTRRIRRSAAAAMTSRKRRPWTAAAISGSPARRIPTISSWSTRSSARRSPTGPGDSSWNWI